MKYSMKKYSTKLVCLVLMAALTWSGYGNVLCYGQDGHVAVESALHNHCHDHDEHASAPAHDETHGDEIQASDGCSPCVDVLIGHAGEPIRLKNMVSLGSLSYNTAYSVGIRLLTAAANIKTYDSFSFFTPLRSIVLLT